MKQAGDWKATNRIKKNHQRGRPSHPQLVNILYTMHTTEYHFLLGVNFIACVIRQWLSSDLFSEYVECVFE